MHRIVAASTAALLLVAVAGSVTVAASNKLRTFGSADIYVRGNTFLIKTDKAEDPTWGGPEYGGVTLVRGKKNTAWQQSRKLVGKPLAGLNVSFRSSGDVTGGSPRLAVPIDETGDKVRDGHAFVDANYCGAGGAAVEDGDTVKVGTTNADCDV